MTESDSLSQPRTVLPLDKRLILQVKRQADGYVERNGIRTRTSLFNFRKNVEVSNHDFK